MNMNTCFLGIDLGTQGLSVVLTDEKLKPLFTAEGSYGCVPDLDEGCFEQLASDWDNALCAAMENVSSYLKENPLLQVKAIGISGQMHGEVLVSGEGKVLQPVRLWCDARNLEEGTELTALFGQKIPPRATCARWLWTCRNRPAVAKQVQHLTTPAGWIHFRLTGRWALGVGDASGMFPVTNSQYDSEKLIKFENLTGEMPKLNVILPEIRVAGQDAGSLTPQAAHWLGLEAGIQVAPAEGDQVCSLAGSLIGRTGKVACSLGTSVCANCVVSDAVANDAVDEFCAHDGQDIHMVCLRNGTTFFNSLVESYRIDTEDDDVFARILPLVLKAPQDCDGLIALPFMEPEPTLKISTRAATILGWNHTNATPGNICKSALLATLFNLKLGMTTKAEEMVVTGGLTKTPACGQIVADVFQCHVKLLEGSEEGCAWGAAVMAKYRHSNEKKWPEFIEDIPIETLQTFEPRENYDDVFARYQRLLALQDSLSKV